MIQRDPAWWDAIAQHPEVAPSIFMGLEPRSLDWLVQDPNALPLASENGGLIFLFRDPLKMLAELHTLFRPEGWGREVAQSARRFMAEAFKTASLIVTHEQEGQWRTRPPKSHGWSPCADFQDVGLSRRLRPWVLTRDAWNNSPVGRKSCL